MEERGLRPQVSMQSGLVPAVPGVGRVTGGVTESFTAAEWQNPAGEAFSNILKHL